MKKFFTIVFALFLGATMYAQTTVTGTVTDSNDGQPIPGANIKVEGKALGTTTDFDGKYELQVSQEVPFKIVFSNLGYVPQTIEITKNNQVVDVALAEAENTLDEVVVSASRTPESIRESPVTIERMDVRDIRNASAPSFYQGLENLKGVDVNTNSLTFNSVNTRGFATFSNVRFMQLVDGMDNASPALNFPLGNLLGMNELDINSVELLPGASSALYGANAFNGILFMTSKSPFDHQGASAYVKTGITVQEAAGENPYYDVGLRFAHVFSEKFAAKVSFSYLQGEDWHAVNYNDFENPGQNRTDPNYDGLNIYGDEVAINMDATFGTPEGTIGEVSRTGYNEDVLMDYDAESVKVDAALHFRPFENDFEIIWNSKFGTGNTIYQGANRYNIKDFFMQQHKLELRNDNFFVRAYTISETAGDSFDSRFAAINVNRRAKSDTNWFTDYFLAFSGALHNPAFGGVFTPIAPAPGDHTAARTFADGSVLNNSNLNPFQLGALNAGIAPLLGLPSWNRTDSSRFVPGSAEFNNALADVASDGDLLTGAKFQDNTKLYHADANYNFKDLIDFADIQIGGSYRLYSLNSAGTIFTDYDGAINYDEYGAYLQIQKKLADDKLKFTGSVRYDEAQNFDGSFSPRVSLVFSPDENKKHNLRASFQTGFRNPTTQDQYIGLDVGRAFLVGSAPDNLDRYNTPSIGVSLVGQSLGVPSSVTVSGRQAYENSFTLTSVRNGTPEKAEVSLVQPERVTAYEAGYRGRLGKIAVDFSAFYNQYQDFISVETVLVPLYGQTDFSDFDANIHPAPPAAIALSQGDFKAFQVYTNSKVDVNSYGAAIGLNTKAGKFDLGVNYSYNKFDFDQDANPDFEAAFNTPEHKVKASFGSTKLMENLGFNINVRWSDEYEWQATFADGMIPSRTIVDAQINYTIPKIKSNFKIGGSNIGGKEYFSAPGVGAVGSMYYLSWVVNM